jgi:hypothetical protein
MSATGRIPDGEVHRWFSLSYANYLVLPRSVLQSMPLEWQERFVDVLAELNDSFHHLPWPEYAVQARGKDGRFLTDDPIPHYDRGRTRLEPAA